MAFNRGCCLSLHAFFFAKQKRTSAYSTTISKNASFLNTLDIVISLCPSLLHYQAGDPKNSHEDIISLNERVKPDDKKQEESKKKTAPQKVTSNSKKDDTTSK